MILTLGIECFRFTPSTVLTNAHLLPVSQTLSSAPSLPTGPPYLQTDASRKHCHQRHHGESPICDFCCQLGLSNLWVLSEHGSPRALFFFFLSGLSFFLMHSQLHPKSTFKKWMLRKMNKRLLERHVKCAFNPTHNMNLMWLKVPWTRLGRSWRWSSFPHLGKIKLRKRQLGIPSSKIHRWHGHYGSGLLVTSCHTTTVSGSTWLLQSWWGEAKWWCTTSLQESCATVAVDQFMLLHVESVRSFSFIYPCLMQI